MNRARALAALDPNAAIRAPAAPTPAPQAVQERPSEVLEPGGPVPAITLAVEVVPPPPFRRWRFFLAWCLLRVAARLYPFKFELYRTPTSED